MCEKRTFVYFLSGLTADCLHFLPFHSSCSINSISEQLESTTLSCGCKEKSFRSGSARKNNQSYTKDITLLTPEDTLKNSIERSKRRKVSESLEVFLASFCNVRAVTTAHGTSYRRHRTRMQPESHCQVTGI